MGPLIVFLIFGVPAILYFAGQVIEWRMRNPKPLPPRADPGKIAKLERQLGFSTREDEWREFNAARSRDGGTHVG